MSVAIVLAFAICLLPLSIFRIVIKYVQIVPSCGWHRFLLASYLLALSNSAVNPCICFVFSGNYRQGLKNLVSCFSTEVRANQVPCNQVEPATTIELRFFSRTSWGRRIGWRRRRWRRRRKKEEEEAEFYGKLSFEFPCIAYRVLLLQERETFVFFKSNRFEDVCRGRSARNIFLSLRVN